MIRTRPKSEGKPANANTPSKDTAATVDPTPVTAGQVAETAIVAPETEDVTGKDDKK